MSDHHPQHGGDLLDRFFGPASLKNGPFGLLGLPVMQLSDASIIAARDRRLDIIDAHKEASTPLADEARLAVHAAAVRLLDPVVQRESIAAISDAPPSPLPTPPRPEPVQSQQARNAGAGNPLQRDALLAIGMAGGWNARALRHLFHVARARGVSMNAVIDAIAPMTRSRRATPSPSSTNEPIKERAGLPASVASVKPSWTGEVMLGVAVVVLVTAAGMLWLLRDRGGNTPEFVPPITASSPEGITRPRPVRPSSAGSDLAAENLADDQIVARLRTIAGDPNPSTEQIRGMIERVASGWIAMRDDRRVASHAAILDLAHSSTAAGVFLAADLLRMGQMNNDEAPSPGGIERSAWANGMLARLSLERDFPAEVDAQVEQAARSLGVAGLGVRRANAFAAGVVTHLETLARRVLATGDEETTARWAACLEAAAADQRDALFRDAIAQLEPDQVSQAGDSISALIAQMDWRNAENHRWLIRLMTDPAAPGDLVYIATRAVAERTSAPGIDLTMIVSASATLAERRDASAGFAEAWGLIGADAMSDLAGMIERQTRALNDRASSSDPVNVLWRAVAWSRLHAAAAVAWRGDIDLSRRLVGQAEIQISAGPEGIAISTADLDTRGDGQWAEDFLRAESNVPEQLDMLSVLSRRSRRMGPIDAETLMHAAVRGSPRAIREAALPVVAERRNDPAIINALLEIASTLPKSSSSEDLVSIVSLIDVRNSDSPDWSASIHRALVTRLIDVTARESRFSEIERLSDVMTLMYDAILDAGDANASPIENVTALIRRKVRQDAEGPFGLDSGVDFRSLEARYEGRRAVATGRIQVFSAEQVSLAELIAAVMIDERGSDESSINQILVDLERERSEASSVLLQIERSEAALVQLWIMRLRTGGGSVS